jgi:hypothetical protein
MGDHAVSYERIGSGWYRYSVHHTATSRKLFDGKCKVELTRDEKGGDCRLARAAVLRTDEQVKRHAEGELLAYNERRTVNAEAYSRGRLDQVVGEKHLPVLPPHRQQELQKAGRIVIKASVPERIVRQAYDVSLKATGDKAAAARAALDAGHKVLIGVSDEQLLAVARREAHLEGDSDSGIKLVAGAEAVAS